MGSINSFISKLGLSVPNGVTFGADFCLGRIPVRRVALTLTHNWCHIAHFDPQDTPRCCVADFFRATHFMAYFCLRCTPLTSTSTPMALGSLTKG